MPVFVGGAELNVAKALAAWKQPVRYVSALPDNYISKEIIDALQEEGIESSAMLLTGDRIGTYTLPMGADLKNAGVIYDRAYSSFSFLKLFVFPSSFFTVNKLGKKSTLKGPE